MYNKFLYRRFRGFLSSRVSIFLLDPSVTVKYIYIFCPSITTGTYLQILLLLNGLGAIPGPGTVILDAFVRNVERGDEATELTVLPHDDGVMDLVGLE